MGLFSRESAEDKAARLEGERELEESLAALGSGGIPPRARKRLEEARVEGGLATSDLDIDEHLLARQAGYEIAGQVMGSSFYKVSMGGRALGGVTPTGELAIMTQAQLAVRNLALSRLKQEAALLGADGVVGVRLKIGRYDWSAGLIEFSAMGTAIRQTGRSAPGTDEPFTSALDGREFWKLRQAGYLPREIAYGVCSYYLHTDLGTASLLANYWGSGMGNQEIGLYTAGFMHARHLAMSRFAAEARRSGAIGTVGVRVDWDVEDVEYEVNDTTYHDLLVHFAALGSAIVDAPSPAPAGLTILSVHDLRSMPWQTTSPPTQSSD
ncbi:MAG TPA: heavy metal-binding domain-containing protein [Rectinemataceae bacterium]|nr:heavy metal-binding domain-containing protein [Rectinemataceae bacterium]